MNELFQNPTQYKTGENYKGTNSVFCAEFKGEKYIIKKPRRSGSLINAYYVFQDTFFHGTRKISSGKERLEREAKCLEILDGLNSPKLIGYEHGVLIREYLKGESFRDLTDDFQRKIALENGLERLLEIHERDVIVGDAHVKNIFVGGQTYWIDFDGVFDESDLGKAKAINLLKFIYSTYSVTRNEEVAIYCASQVSKRVQGDTREKIKGLSKLNYLRLWFPTRLPMNGKLCCEI